MGARTDLAIESEINSTENGKLDGISKSVVTKNGLEVTQIKVNDETAAKRLGKPIGTYITLETLSFSLESDPAKFEERVQTLSDELKKLCGETESVLIVGLGNRDITPDRLGVETATQIFATRHIKRLAKEIDTSGLNEVAVISPGVMGQTGIESAETVKAVCEAVKPELVIAIDALACSEVSHLGSTIQLCDTGISPGSGVENARSELSQNMLGTRVIAIGVPTVIDADTISGSNEVKGMFVTPRGIDNLITRASRLIAMAINRCLQPSLSLEEITSLVG